MLLPRENSGLRKTALKLSFSDPVFVKKTKIKHFVAMVWHKQGFVQKSPQTPPSSCYANVTPDRVAYKNVPVYG